MYTKWDYKRMFNILDLVEGKRVLDVGCGVGEMLLILLGAGYDVTGVDKNISNARALSGLAKLHEMDLKNLTFADGSFDTVIAMEILEHNSEPDNDRMISELRRVGRKLLITVPFCEPEPLYKGHRQSFDAKKINELFPGAKTWIIQRGNSLPWVGICCT